MNDFIFAVLEIFIIVIGTCFSVYIIPYFKQKLINTKYEILVDVVTKSVEAAEQVFKGEGKGKLKKENVITFMKLWFNDHKISVSEDQLSQLIESAVYVMNKEKQNGN